MPFTAQIDSGNQRSDRWQTSKLSPVVFFGIVHFVAFPSTPAQVGYSRNLAWGRAAEGLANVQSPSWSHAD
jgi:hypothetical protein